MAVDVIDEGLRLAAHTALRVDQVRWITLDPGTYLVRGWTPGGELTEATVEVPANGSGVTVDLESGSPLPPAAPIDGLAQWYHPWRWAGDGWRSGEAVVRARTGRNVAVQFGTAEGPTVTTVTIDGLGVTGADATSPEPDGAALSLLHYLAGGDLRSARTLAAEVGALSRPESPTALLAVGYLLARCGDPRLAEWAVAATTALPDSPDAAILSAWSHLQQPSRALRDLETVSSLGLPAVAAGMVLYADGLTALSQTQFRHGDDHPALERIRLVQRAMVPGILTTFYAITPNNPVPAMRPAQLPVADSGPLRPLAVTPMAGRPRTRLWQKSRLPPVEALDLTAERLLPQAKPRQVAALRAAFVRAATAGTQVTLAEMEGLVGDAERGHTWTPPPRTRMLPRFDLLGLRAAGPVGRAETHWDDAESGLVVDCRQIALDRVDIAVQTVHEAPLLVEVHVGDDTGWLPYLVPAHGRITLAGVRNRLDMAVGGVRDPAELTADDADAIARSVDHADRPGRDLWRAILDNRDRDDPVAAAIVEGLT